MNKQIWKVSAAGNAVEIELGGVKVALPGKDVASLVAAILDCARTTGDSRTTPNEGGPIDWLPVKPTTLTLGSSPTPGHESLVLGFGPALLGVSMPLKHLKQLGEAMIALSAEGRPQ